MEQTIAGETRWLVNDACSTLFGKSDLMVSDAADYPHLSLLNRLKSDAKSDQMRVFLHYLHEIHPRSHLPARSDFDPVAVPSILPNLILVRVDRDPIRFMVRIAGDTIRHALDEPLMGRYLDTLAGRGDSLKYPLNDRLRVVETGELRYRYGEPRLQFSLDFARVEYCHFPFANDGRRVDHILSLLVYKADEHVTRHETR